MLNGLTPATNDAAEEVTTMADEILGIHVKRDSWVSVMYAEELNPGKSSVTLQRTDRHGILGQKPSDFRDLSNPN